MGNLKILVFEREQYTESTDISEKHEDMNLTSLNAFRPRPRANPSLKGIVLILI